MFLGHFAMAMAAKKIAPKASLGTLVLPLPNRLASLFESNAFESPRELWFLVFCAFSGRGLRGFPARATASQRSYPSPQRVGALVDGSLERLGRPPARAETRLTSSHEKTILRK